MMEYKNQWAYAGVMSCVVITALVFFFINVGKLDILQLPLFWLFYGGVTAFVSAIICWPRETERTTKRMVVTGILATFAILSFLSYPFGIQFLKAFPSGDTETFFDIVEAGLVLLLLFPIVTLGAPYWVGIIVAICFKTSEG